MKQLPFSYNWNNKLDCNCFTTLRLSDRFNVGDPVEILLKDVSRGPGTIITKSSCKMHELDVYTCMLDTGYGVEETKEILRRMYRDANWSTQQIYRYLVKKQKVKAAKPVVVKTDQQIKEAEEQKLQRKEAMKEFINTINQ